MNQKTAIVVGAVMALALLIAGGIFVVRKDLARNGEEGTKFIYGPENFEMAILPGWGQIATSSANLPKTFTLPAEAAFQKNGSGCTFAYVPQERSSAASYQQTSFAVRVITQLGEQLDASWYVDKASVPSGFKFLWKGRQSMPGEFRIDYYPLYERNRPDTLSTAFVLYDANGGKVPQNCDDDFSTMLRSLQPVIEPGQLTPTSTGILYVRRFPRQPIQLMFLSEGEKVNRSLAALGDSTDVKVMQGIVYARVTSGIVSVDLATGKLTPVLEIPEDKGSIADYLLDRGHIYYLVLPPHGPDRFPATEALYDYSLTGQHSALLAENIPSYGGDQRLWGFDVDTQELYILRNQGDGGCAAVDYAAYGIITGVMGEEHKAGMCADEATPPDAAWKAYALLEEKFQKAYPRHKALMVRNGRIVGPAEENLTASSWHDIILVK